LQDLLGQIEIIDRALAESVVQDHGLANAGRLADLRITMDDGIENDLVEMLAYFAYDLVA
jgi:hypothetical protein